MKILYSQRILPVVFTALFLVLLLAATIQAEKIEPALQQAMLEGEEVSVIVYFADQLDLSSFPGKGRGKGVEVSSLLWALRNQAESSQATAIDILKKRGGKRLIQLWAINGLAAKAKPEIISDLASLPEVEVIRLDAVLAAPAPEPAAYAAPEWNLNIIGAPELWNLGYDGSGIVVASMDTGVDALHPDLAGSYRGGLNSWYDPNGEYDDIPHDNSGHGTQVMSLIVGGGASGKSIGVAPGAQWIAVKIFDSNGTSTTSRIHQGFQWLLDPDGVPTTHDYPDVVNNSWGYWESRGVCDVFFEEDISLLKAAGIAVVFAAGNEGTLGSVSPADNPSSFAVGSVDDSLTIATNSSRGPSACDGLMFPDIVAPGVSVTAASLTAGGIFPNSYASVSGTSFAAPHVSGAMALLRQANPDAPVADLELALRDAAFDLGPVGADNAYGYGLLDAVEANTLLGGNPDCTAEIENDGIDQDCNGYDLTIEILAATYLESDQELTVEATSSLGREADLELVGYGSMRWNRKNAKWTITVGSVANDPGLVTVRGIEGEKSLPTTVELGDSSGGGKGGGKKNK